MKRFQLAVYSATFVLAVSAAFAATQDSVHPIVDAQSGYLLGGSKDGKWIKDKETASALQQSNANLYRLYGNMAPFRFSRAVGSSSYGRAGGSKPKSADEPCPDTFFVKLSSGRRGRIDRTIPTFRRAVIAVGAQWNAVPREPRPQNLNQKIYINEVAKILKANKIKKPKVVISQLWRVDLDGDKVAEVLLSATNYAGEKAMPKNVSANATSGEYSLVLLRKVVKGKVQTIMLAQEIYAQNKEFSAPNVHRIAGVYDLNGDGRMEILLNSRYYEGDWMNVIEVQGAEAKEVLSAGCGA